MHVATIEKIRAALENAGIEFLQPSPGYREPVVADGIHRYYARPPGHVEMLDEPVFVSPFGFFEAESGDEAIKDLSNGQGQLVCVLCKNLLNLFDQLLRCCARGPVLDPAAWPRAHARRPDDGEGENRVRLPAARAAGFANARKTPLLSVPTVSRGLPNLVLISLHSCSSACSRGESYETRSWQQIAEGRCWTAGNLFGCWLTIRATTS